MLSCAENMSKKLPMYLEVVLFYRDMLSYTVLTTVLSRTIRIAGNTSKGNCGHQIRLATPHVLSWLDVISNSAVSQ